MFEIIENLSILLINAFIVFILIVVISNTLKTKANQWFVIMAICMAGWVNFSYLGLSIDSIRLSAIFYRLNYVFVAIFLFSVYTFIVKHILEINTPKLRFFIGFLSLFFAFLSIFSNYLVAGAEEQSWGNTILRGELDSAFSIFSLFVAILIVYFIVSLYAGISLEKKRSLVYFLVGIGLFILFNTIFNVVVPIVFETTRYQNWGDYSASVLLIFTAYSIVARKFLEVKTILTAILISIVGALLVVDILLLSEGLLEQFIKVVIFIFFIIVSILLVRSVLNEIRQRERIEELSREQKDIIDVMGHEIRTPLTAIVQEVNLNKQVVLPKAEDWKAGKLDKAKEKEFIELVVEGYDTIDKASHQATHLVNDMLETARLDKERFELEYAEFDLVEEAKTAAQIAKKSLIEKNIEIDFSSRLKTLEVKADKTRIRESIDNLISNAVKYKDPNKEKTNINVSVTQEGKYAIVSIKDNGRGIAREDIPKLGKKFFRLDNKMNGSIKRPGGTGLGLFVVKGIMEYHKGTLTIESDGVGKGSEFILKFPKINN